MKYKSSMYAEALVQCLLDKKIDKNSLTEKFLALLEKNGDAKRATQIIALAESIFLKKTGAKKIILETARPIDTKQFIASFAKKGDMVEERINPKIIAGINIIINNEQQFDNSLLRKLNSI